MIDISLYRFGAVWDDRDSEHGEMSSYVVSYYLQDDSVEVTEVHKANDGKDPFPRLLKKCKLPKNWKEVPGKFDAMFRMN